MTKFDEAVKEANQVLAETDRLLLQAKEMLAKQKSNGDHYIGGAALAHWWLMTSTTELERQLFQRLLDDAIEQCKKECPELFKAA